MIQKNLPSIIIEDMFWSPKDINAYEYLNKINDGFSEKILPYLKGKDVVVQAGGHCGWMIREFKKIFKYIYTFEPDYLHFLALCMNFPTNDVFKFQACLGQKHELVNLCDYPGGSGGNYVGGKGKIPTLLIDDLNLDVCDFIQLDLEGYEYYALLGAKETIKKFKPLICVEEYWNDKRYNISVSTIENFLIKENGYKRLEIPIKDSSDVFYQYV